MLIKNNPIPLESFVKFREAVGWPKPDENAAETALRNSLYSVVAIENGNVIGFGRIVGDGGLYFYIQDVIVHPDHQGEGVGKALMAELLRFVRAHAQRGTFVGLMAAKGRASFYEAFGFRARDTDAPGMYMTVE